MTDWTTPSRNPARYRLRAAQAEAAQRKARGHWFARHWRGELALPVAYWVNGVLVASLVPRAFEAAVRARDAASDTSLRTLAALQIFSVLLALGLQAWGAVGTIRSATRYAADGGSAAWAALARIVSAVGLVATIGVALLFALGGEGRELFAIASGHDSLPAVEAQVSADGRALVLVGPLGTGSGERALAAMRAAPRLRLVHLSSPGGRLYEATLIAREVARRRLDTYVEDQCASACTFIFLAGQDRGATPNARIGFHRASFAGMDSSALAGNRRLLETYRAAGVSPAFLERVEATSSRSIWYPTRDELVANHVITRVSLGGEGAGQLAIAGVRTRADLRERLAQAPLWAGVERRFPGTLDRAVDAAWAASRGGANDEDVFTAARGALMEVVPKALASAPDTGLDAFGALFVDELDAALALSPQACGKYLDGRLEGAAVFPPALLQRDQQVLEALFAAPPAAVPSPTRAELGAALQPVLERLSPGYLRVVQAPEAHAGEPQLRCESLRALYRGVLQLPDGPRHTALRGLLGHE
jgi:hypothetical protein